MSNDILNKLKEIDETFSDTTLELAKSLIKVGEMELERDTFEDCLERTDRLLTNIIEAAKKFCIINEMHDYLLDKVDKPIEQNGLERDTFQYFVDLMIISE
ncbi:hypothetical protein [Paenibacillus donghaensis]|uniref:Uncharacterized protein n=1 Tax=Paenibacillus donghaensis TaxID=414771 RepID=A0A2Z2K8Y0_9BACL|nr:hypothetical protein [Paenibacillus donghaensis]ASA21797.1 hypothetical protein B9T62_14065 [Paenibacillus donghaensis]